MSDSLRDGERSEPEPRLAPLVLAAMASQSLIVVLAPTIVAVANDLGVSVGAVGQARSIAAAVAVVASIAIVPRIDAIGLHRLLGFGAVLAIVASATLAASPALWAFFVGHVLVGLSVASLLAAGFAGAAAFPKHRRSWAVGYVAGSNALAWIVVNPVVGTVTDSLSWRAAEAVPALIAIAALAAARRAEAPAGGRLAPRVATLLASASVRRWLLAEVIAYAAWTSLLTFVGAFFIEQVGAGEVATGWSLAAGAAAFFVASSRSGALAAAAPLRYLVAGAALLMAPLSMLLLNATASVPTAVGIFCLLAVAAGVRTPASSALGLEQLPDHPGAMMAARTAANQLGYLLGAIVGGAVIAGAGFATLGIVLAAGLASSSLIAFRVVDGSPA